MSKAVLLACWPWFVAMLIAFASLWLLVRLSGARWNLAQLRMLNSCQRGSTQTLSFVLTLPLFIMIALFIIQLSQLMIGATIVHYAAFATARSASVWIPATLISETDPPRDPEERSRNDSANLVRFPYQQPMNGGPDLTINQVQGQSRKMRKIWMAAVNACAAASPSRPLYPDESDRLANPEFSMLYQGVAPASRNNTKTLTRLQSKLSYSARNTLVKLQWTDKDIVAGPTYNPIVAVPIHSSLKIHVPHENEVGWDSPVTLTVQHRFALLPGPGRFLAARLAREDGRTDNVSNRIMVLGDTNNGKTYATLLSASVTLTNEGLKSVLPYVEHED